MPNIIKIKRSSTPGVAPISLSDGEIAINQADNVLFFKDSGGVIRSQKIGFTVLAPGQQIYTGSIAWAGTAPLGPTNHTYNWQQVGNLVTLQISLSYSTSGANNSQVLVAIPSDCPTPLKPTSMGNDANEAYSAGYGRLLFAPGATSAAGQTCYIKRNAANNGDDILMLGTTNGYRAAIFVVTYFTA